MKLANLIQIGLCPILAAWLGCNAILGLDLGEPEETGSGAGASGGSSGSVGSVGSVGSGGSGALGCGNGKLDTGEECDDGDGDAKDGCDDFCQVECELPDGLEGLAFEDEMTHHCYLDIHDTAPPLDQEKPWYDALYLCRAHGFDLAAVTTNQEHDLFFASFQPEVWIGGTDQAEEGAFEWSSGEPWALAPWSSGEPNNTNGHENCVEYQLSGLDDRNCKATMGFICERHPPGLCGDGVIDAAEECDDGNDEPDDGCTGCQVDCENIEANGVVFEDPRSHHCYIEVAALVNWQTAGGGCGDIYGFYMATVSSAEELAYLHLSPEVTTPWVGATDAVTEDTWVWSSGEAWEFIPWVDDPVNSIDKNCLRFELGDIIAADCAEHHAYLCERDPIGRRSPDAPER